MQPFDFFTRYCCLLIFLPLVILMFAALSVGSVTWGALFGLCSFMVRVVEEDLVRWMAAGEAVKHVL